MCKRSEFKSIIRVIKEYDLRPKKSLSQNFLIDINLTEKIVHSLGDIKTHDILEIGPGPGSLTLPLLKLGARKVIAVEKDQQFLAPLEELGNAYPKRLKVINEDIFSIDVKKFLKPPIKIISNLPYNIGTKILIEFMTADEWPPYWDSLTFMFQQEVADRIVSKPRLKSYGRLSIISQWRSRAKILFSINANRFVPAPTINSAVVQFLPNREPIYRKKNSVLEDLLALTFGKRRKMLRHSLRSTHSNIENILLKIGISPQSRPEELSVEDFCNLANALTYKKN